MLPYIKVFPDLSETVDLLSDAEAGRLLKSLLHYANGGEDELPGQEKLVYAMLKKQIDRDAAEYERYSEKQRANGCKGGRPKKPRETQQNPKNPLVFSETQKSQEEDKEKEKDKEEECACAREASPAPFMTPEECDRAAEQYDRVKTALVRVGIQPTLQAMDTAMGLLADYGEDRLLAALRTASDHDRKGGVNWPFVRRILEDRPRSEPAKSLYEIPFIQGGEVIR